MRGGSRAPASSSPPPPFAPGAAGGVGVGFASPYRRPSPPGSPATGGTSTSGGGGAGPHEAFLCCCYACPAPRAAAPLLASAGVCLLVLGYTLLGAFTFMTLEGGGVIFGNGGVGSDTPVAASKPRSEVPALGADIRSRTVDRLWSITEDLNILYKENWTRLAAQEVLDFQDSLVRALRRRGVATRASSSSGFLTHDTHRWTFSSSFLYSLTLITTIGYGSVSPRTAWGKVAAIAYAAIGIPLMLAYLSTTGDALARSFRRAYARARRTGSGNNISKSGSVPPTPPTSARFVAECRGCRRDAAVRVPVSLCALIVAAYIAAGALLFHRLENWTILEGSYFCFTSLGTIGFGDLVPGGPAGELSHCVCSTYILLGMALIAMCFNLVQGEVGAAMRALGRLCGAGDASTVGSSSSSSEMRRSEAARARDDIAMAVVSS